MLKPVSAELEAWTLARAAAKATACLDLARSGSFAVDAFGELQRVAEEDPAAVIRWDPAAGWVPLMESDSPQRDLLELYLPICHASAARPITIGHLGQSLDGFIATCSGDSSSVTGPENILHLHRLRALCDAIIVGAGTVAADDPQLTTRLVAGSNPVRVILDPHCRLPSAHAVFSDRQAATLRATIGGSSAAAEARARGEELLEVRACGHDMDLRDLLQQLHARGWCRVFVEGGGVTVSSFLEAGLLDRLHIAVAPLLIGAGRPTVRLAPRMRLQDCLRLRHRVYRAGLDILFDCDLRAAAEPRAQGQNSQHTAATIQRVL